jgi:hypothetical protein
MCVNIMSLPQYRDLVRSILTHYCWIIADYCACQSPTLHGECWAPISTSYSSRELLVVQ